MIKVYYAYTEFFREDSLLQVINPLSRLVQSRLKSFKRKEDRLLRMIAYFLLKQALKQNGCSFYQLQDIQYTGHGKPFFSGADFDFSISHTKQCAVVAFSDSRVGIDIEKMEPIDISDFKDIFPREAWNSIHASADKNGTFYKYWTLLESVVKADGRGLSLTSSHQFTMNPSHVFIEGQKWYFQHPYFDRSISCCIASDQKQETIELTEVRLP